MRRPKGGRNTTHSKEEKLVLVKRMLSGESGRQLERESGIEHSQIHKWTKQYLEGGEAALVNKRNASLAVEIGASLFLFGAASFAVLVAVALVTVVVATFLPVYNAAKKKPVDSIRAL